MTTVKKSLMQLIILNKVSKA